MTTSSFGGFRRPEPVKEAPPAALPLGGAFAAVLGLFFVVAAFTFLGPWALLLFFPAVVVVRL